MVSVNGEYFRLAKKRRKKKKEGEENRNIGLWFHRLFYGAKDYLLTRPTRHMSLTGQINYYLMSPVNKLFLFEETTNTVMWTDVNHYNNNDQ